MTLLAGFADISLWQLLLVAAVAPVASVVGVVSGYGTGARPPAEAEWIAQGFPHDAAALDRIADDAAKAPSA